MPIARKNKRVIREAVVREGVVNATAFKAHCLEMLDNVRDTRVPLVVTKHGKPVARVVPIDAEVETVFGALRHYLGAIDDAALIAPEPWPGLDDDVEPPR
ncbi:MAG TPA: type II toxin-antitoxin system Phd/YefM family antitoxin [Gemmatimonadaceae bacterium]